MSKLMLLLLVAWTIGIPTEVAAHCQVPCGIYDDHARIHSMEEDVATIAKAVAQLQDNEGKADAQAFNQRVRWTQTKEQHASNIITVVSEYFLTQKIKPADPADKKAHKDYMERLAACHQVLRAAMKSKQTVDAGAVEALAQAVQGLAALYPAK